VLGTIGHRSRRDARGDLQAVIPSEVPPTVVATHERDPIIGHVLTRDDQIIVIGSSTHTGLEADLLGRIAAWYGAFQELAARCAASRRPYPA